MWETQAGKFTNSNKVNVDFCLPEFSATKILSWKCCVDNSTTIRYNMILGRDLITTLVLDIIFPKILSSVTKDHIKGARHPWLTSAIMTLNI